MELTITPDLTVKLGRENVRLTTAQGFATAQTLIRLATRRLVQEEMGLIDPAPEPRGSRSN